MSEKENENKEDPLQKVLSAESQRPKSLAHKNKPKKKVDRRYKITTKDKLNKEKKKNTLNGECGELEAGVHSASASPKLNR